MIALIDADMLSYSIPFALQDKEGLRGSKWECREMLDRMISTIMEDTKASSFNLFLSGKDNFREGIATLSPYKGNRQSEKPFFYPYIRELVVSEYKGQVSEGKEADDDIAIEQQKNQEGTIICSLDKDFNQCAGKHYSWAIKRQGKVVRPSSLYEIDEEQAIRNLYAQAITGDNVDNILYTDGKKLCFLGKGEKKAHKLLEGANTEEECKARIMEWYYSEFPQDDLGLGWKDAFYEIMSLLYLLRHEGDRYERCIQKD